MNTIIIQQSKLFLFGQARNVWSNLNSKKQEMFGPTSTVDLSGVARVLPF